MIIIVEPFEEYTIPTPLTEAKGLYSIKSTDDVRDQLITLGFSLDKGAWKVSRRNLSKRSNVAFKKLSNNLITLLDSRTKVYLSGDISFTRWRMELKSAMRKAYFNSFALGLAGAGDSMFHQKHFSPDDRRYVESAFRHEMRFFNKMLSDIRQGSLKGNLNRRLAAYASALKAIYYSGRIMGTPDGMIIDWISPLDRNTCKGCHFLASQSPFTKYTLPTTPRAGNTACLNNCRCRLVMREVSHERFLHVKNEHYSKRWYSDQLRKLKR